jgi:hypothetical protein
MTFVKLDYHLVLDHVSCSPLKVFAVHLVCIMLLVYIAGGIVFCYIYKLYTVCG